MRWARDLGRLPAELEAAVCSGDIVEQMAFEQLEPTGPLHLEFMLGQLCATVANVNRDPKTKAEAWSPRDFMPALAAHLDAYARPQQAIFLEDPEAMSRLIKAQIFKVRTDG